MDTEIPIEDLRRQLGKFFEQMSVKTGINTNPQLTSSGKAHLWNDVFGEAKENRAFLITAREKPGIEVLFKDMGVDDEYRLLHIIADSNEAHRAIFWEAYRAWLHDGIDEADVLKLLKP